LVGQKIEPHIPVWDKDDRTDGTFNRLDFVFDAGKDEYKCQAGRLLKQFRRNYKIARTDSVHNGIRKYRASQKDCHVCELKPRCCPNMQCRKVLRSVDEEARDHARQLAATTSSTSPQSARISGAWPDCIKPWPPEPPSAENHPINSKTLPLEDAKGSHGNHSNEFFNGIDPKWPLTLTSRRGQFGSHEKGSAKSGNLVIG
jgi:hypothetical protein